jgi:O-antigen ligase
MASPTTSLLHRFRADRKSPPLHTLEKAVLIAVIVHVGFLPWALGTMHTWSQFTSLGLALIGFALALLPRTYDPDDLPMKLPATDDRRPAAAYRLATWPRLLRFPLFWIGLGLLGYITVQGCNPLWVWHRNETSWWLARVPHITWLPSSVDAPFDRSTPWRALVVYGSAWLTLCTIWVGFTRRKTLQVFLTAILINAVILAVVGFGHRILSMQNYFGFYSWPPGASPFASFIYKNHAGAFFALITSLTIALALWSRDHGLRSGRKSTPASFLIFIALLLFAAVLATASRGATITVVTFALLISVWLFFRNLAQPAGGVANRGVAVLLVLAFAGTLVATVRHLDFSAIGSRFEVLSKDPGSTVADRLLAYDAGMDMLAEHWVVGVGAGSFRHLFPLYVSKHPSIYANGSIFWDQIHRDWLQVPIELGLIGCLFLVAGIGYTLFFFIRARAPWHFLAVPVLLGCGQTLMHAWFDFPFQCPAILITWISLIAVAARWVELDAA